MKANDFFGIVSDSLLDVYKINKKIEKNNLLIKDIELEMSFSPDSELKNISLAKVENKFMDRYKETSYFNINIKASVKRK